MVGLVSVHSTQTLALVAFVLLVVAGVVAAVQRSLVTVLLAAGLAVFVLAFT